MGCNQEFGMSRRNIGWGKHGIKPFSQLCKTLVGVKPLNFDPVLVTAIQALAEGLPLHYVKHPSIKNALLLIKFSDCQ